MTGQPDEVSLSSLASALDRSEDEVRSMLQQVRSRGHLPGQRRFADPGGWLSAGLAAVAVGLILVIGGLGFLHPSSHATASAAPKEIKVTAMPSGDLARSHQPGELVIELAGTPVDPVSRA
jgi:hypothetical protein